MFSGISQCITAAKFIYISHYELNMIIFYTCMHTYTHTHTHMHTPSIHPFMHSSHHVEQMEVVQAGEKQAVVSCQFCLSHDRNTDD